MNKIITLILINSLSIFLFNFNSYGYNPKIASLKNKATKDSILVLKSESTEVKKFDSNKNIESKTTKTINYHIINFDTNEIIFFFKFQEKVWKSKSFEFYSTIESNEMIEFNTTSDVSLNIKLDINPYKTIVYSLTNGLTLTFGELKIIKNEDFSKLGIYKWIDSYAPIEYSKKIIIKERIKGFEYSEYWRKESFKKAVSYIINKMGRENTKCKMISRSSYNPIHVKYIGNQAFRVNFYAEYDCNQDYINQAYFWVNAYYLGYGKWSLELEDQKLTH